MKIKKNIGVKAPNDIDSSNKSLYLKAFFWLLFPFFFICVVLWGYLTGLGIAIVLSLIFSVIVVKIGDKTWSILSAAFGGRQSQISMREQLEGRLKAARVAKMNKEFKQSLVVLNEILEQDPSFYEALFVKAQVLDEGFDKRASAKKYTQIIIENTAKGETIHEWAVSFYQTLEEKGGKNENLRK